MNCMMIYVTVLQLLIFCFGIANFLPFSPSSEQETHTFRWATTSDLKDAFCAIGLDLKEHYKYNGTNNEFGHYITGVRFYGSAPPEMQKEKCTRKASLFMLVGNPGIVWHPETGQCEKTKMLAQAARGMDPHVISMTFKYLTTSHECNNTEPDIARFKLDRKRPHRLSFIENADPKIGKPQEEWCIRNCLGDLLQVVPDCNRNNLFYPFVLPEVYFLEIV